MVTSVIRETGRAEETKQDWTRGRAFPRQAQSVSASGGCGTLAACLRCPTAMRLCSMCRGQRYLKKEQRKKWSSQQQEQSGAEVKKPVRPWTKKEEDRESGRSMGWDPTGYSRSQGLSAEQEAHGDLVLARQLPFRERRFTFCPALRKEPSFLRDDLLQNGVEWA